MDIELANNIPQETITFESIFSARQKINVSYSEKTNNLTDDFIDYIFCLLIESIKVTFTQIDNLWACIFDNVPVWH